MTISERLEILYATRVELIAQIETALRTDPGQASRLQRELTWAEQQILVLLGNPGLGEAQQIADMTSAMREHTRVIARLNNAPIED